jgi:hypothetical protein
MKYLVLLFLILPLCVHTEAQETSNVSAIQKLSFLIGNWSGTGWVPAGQAKDPVSVTQDGKIIRNGSALQLGLSVNFPVHDYPINYSIILTYDPVKKKYVANISGQGVSESAGEALLTDHHTLACQFLLSDEMILRYIFSNIRDIRTVTGEIKTPGNSKWLENFVAHLKK